MFAVAPTPTGARAAFRRARRGSTPARPRHLGGVTALLWRPARLRTIPLDAVVGTVDPTSDFDACFRPASDRVASRWLSIARRQQEGRSLPPIAAVERPDGFYVMDGRHRVSVARAFDQAAIEAWVSPSAALRAGLRSNG
ncbi:MAG: hypothetical protein QOF17_224 [Solirubrobacteraceae bacterium]|jgi:hypothetical protein|nr:hypothetical protein [Solirubrobacteraceae bacterium]